MTIFLHAICIMVSLSSLIVINCIAATEYNACSTYPAYFKSSLFVSSSLSESQNKKISNICYALNTKYVNISIVIIGATCMIMFLSFFFRLMSVFNHCQYHRNANYRQRYRENNANQR